MQNTVCSPEMEFTSSSIVDEPTAYVAFSEDEKDIRPVRYVYHFPKDWRTNGWDKRYLYKTFWSPDPDDSPSKMLKRVPTIPVFEVGAARNKAGYHRASVLMVKESEAELLEALEHGKRISVGLTRYKFTSFEVGTSKRQVVAKEQSEQKSRAAPTTKKNGKPVILKKKVTEKKIKKHQTNQTGSEMEKLRESLKRRFPTTSDTEEENETAEKQSKKVKPAGATVKVKGTAAPKTPNSTDIVRNSNDDSVVHENASDVPKQSVKVKPAGATVKVKGTAAPKTSNSTDIVRNSNDDSVVHENASDVPKQSVRVKPQAAGTVVAQTPDTTDIARNSNDDNVVDEVNDLGHGGNGSDRDSDDDHIKSADDSDDVKDEQDSDITIAVEPSPTTTNVSGGPTQSRCRSSVTPARRRLYREASSSSDLEVQKNVKLDPDYTPRKYVKVKEEVLIQKKTIQRVTNLNLNLQEKIIALEEDNSNMKSRLCILQADFDKFRAKCKCRKSIASASAQSHPKAVSVLKTSDSSKRDGNRSPVGPTVKQEAPHEDSDNGISDVEAGAKLLCETKVGRDDEDSEMLNDSLWPEDVGPELKAMVMKIPAGAKKDVKFMKETAIAIFGPEVLASCSIEGTKKGSKSKGEETKNPKPALNRDKLKSLTDIVLARIMEEEKINKKQAEEHDRCTKKRIHDAIRDGQKWCRERGYGVGNKDNSRDTNMFLMKKLKQETN